MDTGCFYLLVIMNSAAMNRGVQKQSIFNWVDLGHVYYIEKKSKVHFLVTGYGNCLLSSLWVVNTMRTFQIGW